MAYRRMLSIAALAVLVGMPAAVAGEPGVSTARHSATVDNQETGSPGDPSASVAVPWNQSLDGQAPCPEGMSRSATLRTEDFSQIPQSRFNNGWYRVSSGVEGMAARSRTDSSNTRDHMFLNWATSSPGARTMMGFVSRGTGPGGGRTTINVNSQRFTDSLSSSWSGRVFDVTAATQDEQGRLGAWLEHTQTSGAQTTWDVDNAQFYQCRSANVSRVSGSDRYATAAAVAARYSPGVSAVYVARGDSFPDALAASAAAARDRAPLLLVRQNSIPGATATQLDRLNPGRIVVLGNTDAISTGVAQDLEAYTGGAVNRLSGNDRYGTAVAVSQTYSPGVDVLYVASGASFPDALAGGALAGHQRAPVLLVQPQGIPGVVRGELERLQPKRIVALGSQDSVSKAVTADLTQYTSGAVTRIGGTDRYATAAKIANEFDDPDIVFVTTGTNYPDALATAAWAGRGGRPIVLARPGSLPGVSSTAIDTSGADSAILVGGRPSLDAIVMDRVGRALN